MKYANLTQLQKEEIADYYKQGADWVVCTKMFEISKQTFFTIIEELHAGKKIIKPTTEQWIEKANKVHHNRYTYENTVYKHCKEKVIITCRIHGDFEQSPHSHLMGRGCSFCQYTKNGIIDKLTTKSFIEKSIKIHNNKYDYSLVTNINYKLKVNIICPYHGKFSQSIYDHLKGCGCRECAYIYNIFKRDDWIKKAKGRKGTFYIIKCWNEEEEFYKIGITYNTTKKRYKGKKDMPYNWKIIKEVISEDLKYIWNIEKEFKIKIQNNRYLPILNFKGRMTECFKDIKYIKL